jgi:hypothetical protein
MTNEELNELASNKIGSKLQLLLREDTHDYSNWGISA